MSFTKTEQLLSPDQSISLSSQQTTELVTCEAQTALSVTAALSSAKGRASPPWEQQGRPCTPALPSVRAGLFSVGTLGRTKFPSRIGKVPPARSGTALAPGTGSGPCATAASSQQQVQAWPRWPHQSPLTTIPLHTQDTNPSAVLLFLGKISNSNFLIAK